MLKFLVLAVFPVSALLLWLAAKVGVNVRERWPLADDAREDFTFVEAACLTLLGLIIGFTFSMSVSRYDQRKNYEEEEANAIGTEYLRLTFLPPADAAKEQALMKRYLALRIKFYEAETLEELQKVNAETGAVQGELWQPVQAVAAAQPTPVNSLVVAGMNDVLNSQGYTQAAWWNRIPLSAWFLMTFIALACNWLIGYGSRLGKRHNKVILILPLFVAISFLLIADIDSPRGGLIRVHPRNLISLSQSLR